MPIMVIVKLIVLFMASNFLNAAQDDLEAESNYSFVMKISFEEEKELKQEAESHISGLKIEKNNLGSIDSLNCQNGIENIQAQIKQLREKKGDSLLVELKHTVPYVYEFFERNLNKNQSWKKIKKDGKIEFLFADLKSMFYKEPKNFRELLKKVMEFSLTHPEKLSDQDTFVDDFLINRNDSTKFEDQVDELTKSVKNRGEDWLWSKVIFIQLIGVFFVINKTFYDRCQ
ncbi:MAG: hypothetical protein WCD44_04770 [Candidatus Babeliales bacterium]